jgi:hypothetical protein
MTDSFLNKGLVVYVALDQTKYPRCDQPWSYRRVAAVMTVWSYEPVGDHSAAALMDPNGLLKWEKVDPETGQSSWFVITTPKWSAAGSNDPHWPSTLVMEALCDQAVLQRTGLMTPTERMAKLTLQRTGAQP